MRESERQRVLDLLQRLQKLEADDPAPEEQAIHQVATKAIIDEISVLVRRDWLAVYRNGNSIDVVSLT